MYGKATETAIAAMSRLAEVYDEGETLLSGEQIAEARGLPQPFVAKVLSTLSQAGLVVGTRGPGGGFTFAEPPKEVTLYDVFCLFEQEDPSGVCPFGGGICGSDAGRDGDNCPLHDRLTQVHQAIDRVLHETTFETFRKAYRKNQGKANWQYG